MDLFLTSSANFTALASAESGAVGQEVRNIFDRAEKYLFALRGALALPADGWPVRRIVRLLEKQ